jgi:DNA-binding transcriptional ArsR family regulator
MVIPSTDTGKNEQQDMAEIMKAAAHPDRLAILHLLHKKRSKRLSVKTIYCELGMHQAIASRHLNILKNAGVVKRLQEGQKTYYCLCNEKKSVQSLSKCYC